MATRPVPNVTVRGTPTREVLQRALDWLLSQPEARAYEAAHREDHSDQSRKHGM